LPADINAGKKGVLLSDIYLVGALLLCCIMQIAVVMIPVTAQVFKMVPRPVL